MKPRMLCTDCGTTARPDTKLEGSDWVEILGWLAGAVPGWLYCAWRHALRIKICPWCGGRELVREARASAQASPARAEPASGPCIGNLHGPVRWPQAWRSPRQRLRVGGGFLLLVSASLLVYGASLGGLLGLPTCAATGVALAGAAAGGVLREARRVARVRSGLCRAWDASGRPLRIDLIGAM